MSFNGQRYLTRGVQSEIPFELQMFMWHLIDELPEPRDYLQVFRLAAVDSNQQLIHEQEEPNYHKEYFLNICSPVTSKVYVIDDGTHSTMLLAEEY